jgi:hypothetical protein
MLGTEHRNDVYRASRSPVRSIVITSARQASTTPWDHDDGNRAKAHPADGIVMTGTGHRLTAFASGLAVTKSS